MNTDRNIMTADHVLLIFVFNEKVYVPTARITLFRYLYRYRYTNTKNTCSDFVRYRRDRRHHPLERYLRCIFEGVGWQRDRANVFICSSWNGTSRYCNTPEPRLRFLKIYKGAVRDWEPLFQSLDDNW